MNPDPTSQAEQDIAQTTARLRADHRRETTGLQKFVDRLTGMVGLPGFVAFLALAIAVWISGNSLAERLGFRPLDPPPFAWLELAVSAGALLVAVLIVTTERREEQLASNRAQLALEMAILNDRKISKIIELLEEMRRDSPVIKDRVDGEATQMATPTDPHAVLKAIKDVTEAKEE
jgi:uncharacterized membrane protein